MKSIDCLIVDDEPDICELLEITLSKMSLTTLSAGSLSEARVLLQKNRFRLCLTDMRLPDGDGIDLVEYIGRHLPDMPVAMITAHGNMDSAIRALKTGAFDFVTKPVDLSVLRTLVETALKLPGETSTRQPLTAERPYQGLIGSSVQIESIRALTRKLARNQAPVHISGESGTGKEVAARLIHNQGPRADKPFIAVNCGAVPQELMESEFFGHVKGSFTGATADKKGLFQAAHTGTLFLDEVGDLPVAMQVKLLRVIQEKKVRAVGGTIENNVDVRIISATHRDLHQLVEEGQFRQDLFYRLNVIELNMPALRDHPEDLPELIETILDRICQGGGMSKPLISEAALKQLQHYTYPGNVRELENILEGALALHENSMISVDDLNFNRKSGLAEPLSLAGKANLEKQVETLEKTAIENALKQNKWNRTATAGQLGITLRQLRYKMAKLDLDN